MNREHRPVIVIGAGVSGLAAALRMKRGGLDVLLLESGERVGGCMQTESKDGYLLEQGPFNVIVRDPAFNELIHSMRDRAPMVTPDDPKQPRYVYRNGRIIEVPSNPIALLTSPILTRSSRLRLIRGMFRSRPGSGADLSIHDAAVRRFGEEAADTLISALVAGIYAGDSAQLSLKSVFPTAFEIDREARSPIMAGMRKMKEAKRRAEETGGPKKPRGLITFEGGLGAFCDAIGDELGDQLRLRTAVDSIERDDNGVYTLCVANEHGESSEITCDELVLATPKVAAGALLARMAPDIASIIDSIEAESLVILNIAFDAKDIERDFRGYGFLVPRNEPEFPLLGTLFASAVFPMMAPEGKRLLRVFFGGSRDRRAIDRSDEELTTIAIDTLRDQLGVTGEPELVNICRYRDAIPQMRIGHSKKVESIARELAGFDGLHLIGNYLTGVAINDCVRTATDAADAIIERRGNTGVPPVRERRDENVAPMRAVS